MAASRRRFARTDEVIAYGGMDIEIKESGLWKGKAKLSKRGSGLLRWMLYMAALRSISLEGSAFGTYYQRLVSRRDQLSWLSCARCWRWCPFTDA